MSEHTPGPWRISPFGSQTGLEITIMGADDYAVARCNDRTPREHMADARLIAAAPDLLAALKLCVDLITRGVLVRDIRNDGDESWAMNAMKLVQDLNTMTAAIAKAEGRGGQP